MTDQEVPAAEPLWPVVLFLALIVLVVIGLGTSLSARATKTKACEDMGGTYVAEGRSVTSQCIKDGKIVIIWHGSERIDNP